jgi:hypothetical protein
MTKQIKKQIILITAICIVVYFGIRSIPVQPCDFLHYKEQLTEDGAIEFCGPDETNFYNLEKMRYPINIDLIALDEVRAGEVCRFRFTLTNLSGKELTASDIGVTHTKKIHLMMVDSSLQDYQHLHPAESGAPGVFYFEMTPKFAGEYRGFLDFVVIESGRKVLLLTKIDVPGEGVLPVFDQFDRESLVGNYKFRIESENEYLKTHRQEVFHLKFDNSENPVSFEPVMGAFAHLVAFDEERTGFAHLHPLNSSLKNQDPYNPELSFTFNVFEPGRYRLWAQVKLSGEEVFVPFNLDVKG